MKRFIISCFFVCTIVSTDINEFSFILNVSTIEGAGIGVFAAHDIAAGSIIDYAAVPVRIVPKHEIPADFLKYCVALGDDLYSCPDRFNRMEILWYLNHSDAPNLDVLDEGIFRVNKAIKKGEEIVIDYNQLGEPEDAKEDYYKQ